MDTKGCFVNKISWVFEEGKPLIFSVGCGLLYPKKNEPHYKKTGVLHMSTGKCIRRFAGIYACWR